MGLINQLGGGLIMSNRENEIWNLVQLVAPVATSTPSLRAIAITVLRAAETGDTDVIRRYVARDLIQHNVLVPDGRDALVKVMEETANLKARCVILRVFGDFDHVVIHSRIRFGDFDLVGMDVFRFEKNMIVEHWQNRVDFEPCDDAPLRAINGKREVWSYESTEDNTLNVLQALANLEKNPDREILYQYLHEDISHHRLNIEPGAKGLVQCQNELVENGQWDGTATYHKAICEGDFVFLMSKVNIGGQDYAVFEILHWEGSKIVERWDIMEPIPEQSLWVDKTGKF